MEFTLLWAVMTAVALGWMGLRIWTERVPDHAFDRLLGGAVAGLAAGRLTAMFSQGINPLTNPGDILIVRGGVHTGAAVLAFIATLYWTTREDRSALDALAPSVLLALAGWHAGCLWRGACLGSQSELPWAWALEASVITRHPVEIYAALGFALAAWLVSRLGWRVFFRAGVALAAAGGLRLLTEPLRPSITGGPVTWYVAGMAVGRARRARTEAVGIESHRSDLSRPAHPVTLTSVEPVVSFHGVSVSLGGRPVLRDIDLLVDPGEAVGIAGPNGSGKTTLVRAAATLIAVDAGTVEVLGNDIKSGDLLSVRRSIGLIGHQPALIDNLTLFENLDHIARLSGIDLSRIPRALEVVGLGDAAQRRAEACSFGMRRRLEIAHLLLTRPRLLLLDEAASGLDEAARDLIGALVESVCGRGGGCLVVSHDRAHLETLTGRVLNLSEGSLEGAR